ncbi:MAG: zinc ABC transporter substrate-binding protein [Firmicutes bacterium]|nr:zinc ABC transporter substrate-binding protein [Bacillota bacterium]
MKRFFTILLILALILSASACGQEQEPEPGNIADDQTETISIVTTVFASYDWTGNLIKGQEDKFDLRFLTDSGVDLHSFQPGVAEIAAVTDCDLLIRTGGESESFIDDIEAGGSFNGTEINLLEILGSDAIMVDGEEGEEPDEHVWLSLRNAEEFSRAICEALRELDPENAELYQSNLIEYLAELEQLDLEYRDMVGDGTFEVVMGDRYPFVYLFRDYGIGCYAAFNGCTSETNASFETVTDLAKKVDELGLRYVLTVEGSDLKVAQAIINVTGTRDQEILELDSMQTVSKRDIEEGKTYLSAMKADLEVLRLVRG